MQATAATLPVAAISTKPLWAAVGVLGVAVAALGATLIHIQARPADGQVALAAAPAAITAEAPAGQVPAAESLQAREALVSTPAKPVAAATAPAPVAKAAPRPTSQSTTSVRPAVAQPTPTAPVATTGAIPAPAPTPVPVATSPVTTTPSPGAPTVLSDQGPLPSQPVAARPVCATCGTVETVTPYQRKAATNGVGAVAGGAVGAVVGNQIGKGAGRAAATILGAIGGGVAGHMIEQNVRKETAYQVRVRMDDGSVRTLDQSSAPAIGSKVTVEGSTLRAADGSWSSAPPMATPAPAGPARTQPDHRA